MIWTKNVETGSCEKTNFREHTRQTSYKDLSILGFVGNMVSIATTQLYSFSGKVSITSI